ncbi:unnamed protein product, partial [Rotaria magnacalcarata]
GIGSRTEVRTINSNDQRRYSTGNNDINNNQRGNNRRSSIRLDSAASAAAIVDSATENR